MMSSPERLLENLLKTLSRAAIKLSALPQCPAVKLNLIDPESLIGPLSHHEAQAVVAEPAYWSFCWASGQVLAAYLLDNKHLVENKVVADVGSGSGVVAIAAALAGAQKVYACDIDRDALSAVQVNAQANQVSIETITGLDQVTESIDLITAADLLYDHDNHHLLEHFRQRSAQVLLADSRMKQLPSAAYQYLTTQEARTYPDLNEFEEFNQVRIYQATGA